MVPQLAAVALQAGDVSGALAFYERVLGAAPIANAFGTPAFNAGGVFIVIVPDVPVDPLVFSPGRTPELTLVAPRFDDVVARLQRHGVAMPWGIETDGDGRWVMISDPAGHLVQFVEHPGSSRRAGAGASRQRANPFSGSRRR